MKKQDWFVAIDRTQSSPREFFTLHGTFDQVCESFANFSARHNILAGYGPCQSKELLAEEIFCINNDC